MSRRKFFYYWLLHALAALAVLFARTLVWSRVEMLGLHPLSVLFVPAIVATYNPLRHSMVYSLCLGLVCDLLMPGPLPIFYLITFSLIAAAAHLVSRRMQPALPCSLAVCLIAWAITGLARMFLLSMQPGFSFPAVMSILSRELVISLLPLYLIHLLFTLLRRHLAQI